MAILTAVSFTFALGFGIVAPAIPAFARQFGVDVTTAASVISVFALMRVVGALPAGRLVDRFGEPGVMAGRPGPRGAQPHLPSRGVGQPGRWLCRAGRARRPRAAVRPGGLASVQHLTNEALAFRAAADDAGILVLLNAGDTSYRFPVDVAGLAVAETPDPRARPADPALVPGHSWVIVST